MTPPPPSALTPPLREPCLRFRDRAGARRPLRFVTFLAPNLYPLYAFITRRVAERLGWPTELFVGTAYGQMLGAADAGFICGLPYVYLTRSGEPPVEPLAAPVLRGERYGGRPVYFSDVIVRRDSPCRSFADLRGRTWSFNEPLSQSGYGITRHHLLRLGETNGFFGAVVEAGWHEQSLRLVADGEVDASAIDSQVLAVALRDRPELRDQLRVIDHLGPSTIQPLVVSRRLPRRLRDELRAVVLELHRDPDAAEVFDHGFVDRFVPVTDADYQDIRAMLAAAEAASFTTIR